MQRYFASKKNLDETFFLSEEDSYHIKKVMRMVVGDSLEVVYEKQVYICEILSVQDLVKVRISEKIEDYNELESSVFIVQSLVKEQKMDFIIQKCTELGVAGFYPYQAERSVVKSHGKEEKKVERWKLIAKEASEQSKRNLIPFVGNVLSLKEICSLEQYDYKFLCTVNEKQENLKKVLSKVPKGATMIIVIGPEGGFTDYEEETLKKVGFLPVSLGKSVLRTETAGLFFLSVVRYIDME